MEEGRLFWKESKSRNYGHRTHLSHQNLFSLKKIYFLFLNSTSIYLISFLFFVRIYTCELGLIIWRFFSLVARSLVFKHVGSKGSSTPPYFYFLGQYLTTWWFQSFWKLFLSLSLVVYLCSTMNIASVNWPAGPKFEYRRKFYFYEWQENF